MYETRQALIDAFSQNWDVEHIDDDFYLVQGRLFIIKQEEDGKFRFESLE